MPTWARSGRGGSIPATAPRRLPFVGDGDNLPTVLLVEDDEVFRGQMARALRVRGYQVEPAAAPHSAVLFVRTQAPDFALVDLRLPGGSGLDVISQIRALSPQTRSFLLSGAISETVRAEAIQRGAAGYLRKPLDADEVIAAFQSTTLR
jgi:two-component system, response regulator RegA